MSATPTFQLYDSILCAMSILKPLEFSGYVRMYVRVLPKSWEFLGSIESQERGHDIFSTRVFPNVYLQEHYI